MSKTSAYISAQQCLIKIHKQRRCPSQSTTFLTFAKFIHLSKLRALKYHQSRTFTHTLHRYKHKITTKYPLFENSAPTHHALILFIYHYNTICALQLHTIYFHTMETKRDITPDKRASACSRQEIKSGPKH